MREKEEEEGEGGKGRRVVKLMEVEEGKRRQGALIKEEGKREK